MRCDICGQIDSEDCLTLNHFLFEDGDENFYGFCDQCQRDLLAKIIGDIPHDFYFYVVELKKKKRKDQK